MAFLVQNDAGSVAGANAYVTVAEFTAYHGDRGNVIVGTNTELEQAIVRATDYLDRRFRFVGYKPTASQTTSWPRVGAEDRDGLIRTGIPREIREVTSEYAIRALDAPLEPDPVVGVAGYGITSKSESVGPISESTTYDAGVTFDVMSYPGADRLLIGSGLVQSGRDIGRA